MAPLIFLLLVASTSAEFIGIFSQLSEQLSVTIPFHQTTLSPLIERLSVFSEGHLATEEAMAEIRSRLNPDSSYTLFNDTAEYMWKIHDKYSLAEDNDECYYASSVIEYFLLMLVKAYKTASLKNLKKLVGMKDGNSFNMTVYLVKQKAHSAYEFAAPVRRLAEIFKSVVGTSVELIQTSCAPFMPDWQCEVVYLVKLILQSYNCPNIWYHAIIYEAALESERGIERNLEEASEEIFKRIGLVNEQALGDDYGYILDVILESMDVLRDLFHDSLLAKADLHEFIERCKKQGLFNYFWVKQRD